ncbi:MAG: CPBP family intramembrane glutamic endopeptidase [Lutimonas sp.]
MNFIQQAYLGKNDWWRYLLTFFLLLFGWQVIGIIPITVVAYTKAGNLGTFIESAENAFAGLGINANLYLFLMLLMFIIGLYFLFLGIKYIHQRAFKTVITTRESIDFKRVIFSFLLWGGISILFFVLGYLSEPELFTWNFKPIPFLILLIISFTLLPFQTSFEEILFRGYAMQGLGLWFKNALMPLVLTSVIFGLLHGFNPEVEKLGQIIMVYYIGTGLMFGICTLMDEGTELALGMHAANNIIAAVLVTSDWMVFQTDALWVDTSEPSAGMETFIPVFVVYPLVLVLFSKKYGWTNWREKLTGPVMPLRMKESETES